jgi:tRNA1(Val) A37 N6-methylase TrmN6
MPLTVANHPFVQELTCDRQQENERLNMQHTILRVLLQNKNWFAPLKRPKRMLDIGCGTGIWCLEMGTSAAQHMHEYTTNIRQLESFQRLGCVFIDSIVFVTRSNRSNR